MKVIIQRVDCAKVEIEKKVVGQINKGLLIFVGFHCEDTEDKIDYLVKKITNLRIFNDENDKMNLSIKDTKGSILVVSQFTLYADCNRGNRPDFIQAAKPETANILYEKFIKKIKDCDIHTETGIFAADMLIQLANNGPVTIVLEK